MPNFMKQSLSAEVKNWIKLWYYRSLEALFSDEQFIKLNFRLFFGRDIDLENPRSFNEKIQYMKLHYRTDGLSRLADKYEVRQYVKEKGLEDILNQLYGVYERVEDLQFDQLPDAFVIKMTNGSGWNIICPDKDKLEWSKELGKLRLWQKDNFYFHSREWVYKQIKPRLIVEKYLQDDYGTGAPPSDFKFFCFNGNPEIVEVDTSRFIDHRRNIYDLEWNLLPWTINYPNAAQSIPKPTRLGEMLEIARKLSEGLVFARIDLYAVQDRIIFGEVTLFPGSGFRKFYPAEADLALGERLDLSQIIKSSPRHRP